MKHCKLGLNLIHFAIFWAGDGRVKSAAPDNQFLFLRNSILNHPDSDYVYTTTEINVGCFEISGRFEIQSRSHESSILGKYNIA